MATTSPDPQQQQRAARVAGLRARVNERLTSSYGPNWRDLPVSREALAQRERQDP